MVDHMYTLPVYRRVLQFAYMYKRSFVHGQGAAATTQVPNVNLGRGSGKTTAAVDYATSFVDVVIITAAMDLADNLVRRNPGIRAFSRLHLDKLPPGNFHSTQPLFVLDDVPTKDTLDILTKFKPERFIHLGQW